MFIIKRILLIVIPVYWFRNIGSQIVAYFLISQIYAQSVVAIWPFEYRHKNLLESFNEISILMMCYPLLEFSDYQPVLDVQYYMGYFFLGQLSLFVTINIIYICAQIRHAYFENKRLKQWEKIKEKWIRDEKDFRQAYNSRTEEPKRYFQPPDVDPEGISESEKAYF